jgi:hypothetical protein
MAIETSMKSSAFGFLLAKVLHFNCWKTCKVYALSLCSTIYALLYCCYRSALHVLQLHKSAPSITICHHIVLYYCATVNVATATVTTHCNATCYTVILNKTQLLLLLLLQLHFGSFEARVPAAVSVVWMAITGSLMAIVWRYVPVKAPKFDRSVKTRFEKVIQRLLSWSVMLASSMQTMYITYQSPSAHL